MKPLRLALAAAAVAAAVVPATASAGIQCTIYWTEHEVGPLTVKEPQCAW